MSLITLLVCLGLTLYSLIATLTTVRRVTKQRDEATEAAERWMRLYFDAATKLDVANSSPFPEGMSQAEYFGITSEKAEEANKL